VVLVSAGLVVAAAVAGDDSDNDDDEDDDEVKWRGGLVGLVSTWSCCR